MDRQALIIYCTNTSSGKLVGPREDYRNALAFLKSQLGGHWYDREILSLVNPTVGEVYTAVEDFLSYNDYSFLLFSGHGYVNANDLNTQYLELFDGDVSIVDLVATHTPRQTIIVDACRGIFRPYGISGPRLFSDTSENFIGDPISTRVIFNKAVLAAEQGVSVLYSASENESALDSSKGGAYFYSLMKTCEMWSRNNHEMQVLNLKVAHEHATGYMRSKFVTNQNPTMNSEKRRIYFPLAVKFS